MRIGDRERHGKSRMRMEEATMRDRERHALKSGADRVFRLPPDRSRVSVDLVERLMSQLWLFALQGSAVI